MQVLAEHKELLQQILSCVLKFALSSRPVGRDGGEADPGSSSQQVHCLLGLRLPVQNRAVSGHDHHERRRLEVSHLTQHHANPHLLFIFPCTAMSILKSAYDLLCIQVSHLQRGREQPRVR